MRDPAPYKINRTQKKEGTGALMRVPRARQAGLEQGLTLVCFSRLTPGLRRDSLGGPGTWYVKAHPKAGRVNRLRPKCPALPAGDGFSHTKRL